MENRKKNGFDVIKAKFLNLRKVLSQIFVKTMWSEFQQNWSKNVEIKDLDRRTRTQIHRQGSSWDNILSPIVPTSYVDNNKLLSENVLFYHHSTERDRPGTTYSVLK